jgi:hypothetical protein
MASGQGKHIANTIRSYEAADPFGRLPAVMDRRYRDSDRARASRGGSAGASPSRGGRDGPPDLAPETNSGQGVGIKARPSRSAEP